MKIRLFLLVVALLILLSGCGNQTSSNNDSTVSVDSSSLPDSDVRGAEIQLYTGRQLTTIIKAEHIRKFEARDSSVAYIVDVDFLDSLGHINSNLVGDSGIIRKLSQHFKVYGHVVVTTTDSARLETDSLSWNPTINKIQTDAFVRLTRHDNIMTGWGLEATRDLKRVSIKQASGEVSETEKYIDDK